VTKVALILSVILIAGCSSTDVAPTFVIHDENRPDEALAVFAPEDLLREHGMTARQYEEAFRTLLDATGDAVASAVVDMYFPGDAKEPEPEPVAGKEAPAWLYEALERTRVEVWRMKADGTHEVVKVFPSMKMSS
jgi:hypothetical protein